VPTSPAGSNGAPARSVAVGGAGTVPAPPAADSSSDATEIFAAPGGLFDAAEVAPENWLDRVLGSDVLTDRLARMRRGAMPADRLRLLLVALDSRGGAATRTAVARALDIPEARVASHVAAAQRVLNIDGYEVLRIDGDTVRLNAALLKTQTGVA
jgi:hypothetical protein